MPLEALRCPWGFNGGRKILTPTPLNLVLKEIIRFSSVRDPSVHTDTHKKSFYFIIRNVSFCEYEKHREEMTICRSERTPY